MKLFTDKDVIHHGAIAGAGSLVTSRGDLIDSPLDWQKRGLQQTATGYGSKLTTTWKINFNGKIRRLYATCFGNAASVWFKVQGRTIYVN